MTADKDMSSRHYEREAEASRSRLAGSLRELSDRLTPGQVFDEMLTYAKGGGGTFLNALSHAARDNPIPSLLIGAGLLMFLSEKTGIGSMMRGHADGHDMDRAYAADRSSRSYRGYGSDGARGYAAERYDESRMYGDGRGYTDGRGRGIRDTLGNAAQAGAGMAQSAASTMQNAAGQAVDGTRRGAERVGAAVAGAAGTARDAMAGAAGTARDAAASVPTGRAERPPGWRIPHATLERAWPTPPTICGIARRISAALSAREPPK